MIESSRMYRKIEKLFDKYISDTQTNQKKKPSEKTVKEFYQIRKDFINSLIDFCLIEKYKNKEV
jgi:hypothetical protein